MTTRAKWFIGAFCYLLLWHLVDSDRIAAIRESRASKNMRQTAGPEHRPQGPVRFAGWDVSPDVTSARVQNIARLEVRQKKLIEAREQAERHREHVSFKNSGAWDKMLSQHLATYRNLIEEAKHSEPGTVRCVVGDDAGFYPCVLCKEQDGRCLECKGTGTTFDDKYCPTCEGTGHCFLCYGYGKMICPFCDDGIIDPHHPAPHKTMPIH